MISGKNFPKYFTAAYGAAACFAYLAGAFTSVEQIWHDRAFEFSARSGRTGDARLILVAVDDETVQKHGFPLPRKVHALALDALREHGVKTVVFDVLFFEKREGDAELAAATKRHGGVVHLFTAEPEMDGNPNGTTAKVSMAIPALAAAAQNLGSPIITHHLENDGHIRTFSLFNADVEDPVRGGGQPTASLAAVSLASLLGKTVSELNSEFGGPRPPDFVLNYRRPTEWLRHEKDDEAWLAAPPELRAKSAVKIIDSPYRTISMLDLLAGRLSAAQRKSLKGALAMIGSTTTGYYDHYPTPFTSHAPGAEYHLNVVDNILNGDFLRATSVLTVLLLVLFAALLPYVFTSFLPTATGAIAAAATLIAAAFGSISLMSSGLMLYPVAPGLTLLAGFLVLTVHRVLTEGAKRQLIQAKFGQFVSPEIVEELANNPERAKLGAQKREMTVFFLDIAHFTTISEKMSAEGLIEFLNRYLSALSLVILDRRGTIDKYIGDCIMAFWNAPLENSGHARDAVLSALECLKVIAQLNMTLDPGLPEIPAIRIGINTGHMAVGFTGTERKLAYTVIGDEVNLASRLEGANKFFHSNIIISSTTYEGSKDAIEVRYLGRARVVGKATPVPVYEPLSVKGGLDPQWAKALPVWDKGVQAFYRKSYPEALAAFEEFSKLMPKDGPGDLYLNLSRDYTALPPDDWDQVFNLTAK
ncbi:MAG: adenylate/guanylate cyclase domain-containing protein [Elusimicrobiota bacterium]